MPIDPKTLALQPFHHQCKGYCLVIGLDPRANQVPLVRKTRPAWQAGRLNYPGGHIEAGESPIVAAARELEEETGVRLGTEELKPVARLGHHGDFELFVFFCISEKLASARTKTEEPVELLPMSEVAQLDEGAAVENVAWLWRMAFEGFGKFADLMHD